MYVLHGCCARRASELIKAVGRWFDAVLAANYGRQHLNQFLPDLIYTKRHRWQELLRNLYKRRFDLLTFSTIARIFASIFIGSFQLWLPFCVFFFHNTKTTVNIVYDEHARCTWAHVVFSDGKTTEMIFLREGHSFRAQLIAHLRVWSSDTRGNIKWLRKNHTQGRS